MLFTIFQIPAGEEHMKTRYLKDGLISTIFCSILAVFFTGAAQEGASDIGLPKPQLDKGRPLMQVLKDRKSSRVFDSKPLSRQDLSNLLWAAFGINRPEKGGRTAPSAMDRQEIDVYVSLAEGLYLYEAKSNSLKKIHGKDIREMTGKQPFVKDAAANVILVADFSRVKHAEQADSKLYAAADAGFISQNIYLYCASEGLATVVRASIDKASLAAAMQLKPQQEIIFAQTVGYPKK
jgi:SagB-type dehydrogenase family enzyme